MSISYRLFLKDVEAFGEKMIAEGTTDSLNVGDFFKVGESYYRVDERIQVHTPAGRGFMTVTHVDCMMTRHRPLREPPK